MSLSPSRFEKAIAAIDEYARPIDRALFAYHFEDGRAEVVATELARFQNDDGGFGNALEPDFRLDASSPMATSVGLKYAVEVDMDATEPLVRNAVDYLVQTYDREDGYWPATFEDVNDAPHAPWWHVDDPSPPTEAEWPNPSAELLGYCWRYRSLVPEAFLEAVTERARENVRAVEIVGDEVGRRYVVLCWERALAHLPDPLARDVRHALERTVDALDPLEEALQELPAFAFAFSPETTVARMDRKTVERALANDVEKQAADGGWWPEWQWGQYEDVWPTAEREWAGKLTLECLLALDRFGMIER